MLLRRKIFGLPLLLGMIWSFFSSVSCQRQDTTDVQSSLGLNHRKSFHYQQNDKSDRSDPIQTIGSESARPNYFVSKSGGLKRPLQSDLYFIDLDSGNVAKELNVRWKRSQLGKGKRRRMMLSRRGPNRGRMQGRRQPQDDTRNGLGRANIPGRRGQGNFSGRRGNRRGQGRGGPRALDGRRNQGAGNGKEGRRNDGDREGRGESPLDRGPNNDNRGGIANNPETVPASSRSKRSFFQRLAARKAASKKLQMAKFYNWSRLIPSYDLAVQENALALAKREFVALFSFDRQLQSANYTRAATAFDFHGANKIVVYKMMKRSSPCFMMITKLKYEDVLAALGSRNGTSIATATDVHLDATGDQMTDEETNRYMDNTSPLAFHCRRRPVIKASLLSESASNYQGKTEKIKILSLNDIIYIKVRSDMLNGDLQGGQGSGRRRGFGFRGRFRNPGNRLWP